MFKPIKHIQCIFVILFFLGFAYGSYCQAPPPPPDGGSNTQNNKLDGRGAPIDGGLGILLALGGAYGARKIYKMRKEKKEQEEEI
jgi:hypothetical protein